jgi:uncharacterized protein YdiU (UPF0061 family)
MANRVFHTREYINEIKANNKINKLEQPIIDKYYDEFRAKLKPTIATPIEFKNDNEIRNYLINELSPILHNQTSNFVETLSKSNDLKAFYKFGRAFLHEVKDIRNLDSNFLNDLWSKYKSKMVIASENIQPSPTTLTATQYENLLKNKKSLIEQVKKQKKDIKKHGSLLSINPDLYQDIHHPSNIYNMPYAPTHKEKERYIINQGNQYVKQTKTISPFERFITTKKVNEYVRPEFKIKPQKSKFNLNEKEGHSIVGVPYLARR